MENIDTLKSTVIEPQNIENWGYGFYQHNLHRDISILSNKLSDELIAELKDHALSNRSVDYRHRLAGQIAEEYETPFDSNQQLKDKLDFFLRQQTQNFLGQVPSEKFEWFAWTNI